MKMLLLLVAFTGFGDFTNQIALEAAKAKLKATPVVQKVLRSQCTKCKGTGKIAAGDGVTKVTRVCDACIDDSALNKQVNIATDAAIKAVVDISQLIPKLVETPESSPQESTPKTAEVNPAEGRTKRILAFHAEWCVNCKADHESTNSSAPMELLTAKKWSISESNDSQIQIIDVDKNPELAKQFKAESLPVYVLVYKGQEIARKTGRQSANALGQLFDSGRVNNQYLRNWCRTYKPTIPAEVEKQSYQQHLTDPAAEEHHEGGPFTWQQLYGLTQNELMLIHSGQHEGVLTPFGALK